MLFYLKFFICRIDLVLPVTEIFFICVYFYTKKIALPGSHRSSDQLAFINKLSSNVIEITNNFNERFCTPLLRSCLENPHSTGSSDRPREFLSKTRVSEYPTNLMRILVMDDMRLERIKAQFSFLQGPATGANPMRRDRTRFKLLMQLQT